MAIGEIYMTLLRRTLQFLAKDHVNFPKNRILLVRTAYNTRFTYLTVSLKDRECHKIPLQHYNQLNYCTSQVKSH